MSLACWWSPISLWAFFMGTSSSSLWIPSLRVRNAFLAEIERLRKGSGLANGPREHWSPSNAALPAAGAVHAAGAGGCSAASSQGIALRQSIQLRGERSFPGSFLTRLCLALVNGTSQSSVKKPLSFQLVKRPRTPSPVAHQEKNPSEGRARQQELGRGQGWAVPLSLDTVLACQAAWESIQLVVVLSPCWHVARVPLCLVRGLSRGISLPCCPPPLCAPFPGILEDKMLSRWEL